MKSETEKTPEVRIQELEKRVKFYDWTIFLLSLLVLANGVNTRFDYGRIKSLNQRVELMSEYQSKYNEQLSANNEILKKIAENLACSESE